MEYHLAPNGTEHHRGRIENCVSRRCAREVEERELDLADLLATRPNPRIARTSAEIRAANDRRTIREDLSA
jgi:hypothetical protein